ncbi:MAG: hypothetical protein AAF747_03055 [Planctomycetota bacterium]
MLHLAIAIAAGLCLRPAVAVQPSASDVLASMPSGVTAVVIVDKPAELRHSGAAKAASAWLRKAGLFEDLDERLASLADEVGLETDDAFASLFGQRLILLVDGIGDEAEWAVVTELDAQTANTLVAGLRGRPRRVVEGQQVLAVERARFNIARASNDRVILAPASADQLLAWGLAWLTSDDAQSLASDRDLDRSGANELAAQIELPGLGTVRAKATSAGHEWLLDLRIRLASAEAAERKTLPLAANTEAVVHQHLADYPCFTAFVRGQFISDLAPLVLPVLAGDDGHPADANVIATATSSKRTMRISAFAKDFSAVDADEHIVATQKVTDFAGVLPTSQRHANTASGHKLRWITTHGPVRTWMVAELTTHSSDDSSAKTLASALVESEEAGDLLGFGWIRPADMPLQLADAAARFRWADELRWRVTTTEGELHAAIAVVLAGDQSPAAADQADRSER